ncbi:MAG TPA: histidine--tRNA ligase [Polyangiaceae bacterium]|jgi:histidyl-tRNA synthetase|nr:histidine--tRNA ligase [Polyangiaceae bacterium]
MQFRAVKGTNDILPDEVRRWQRVEEQFRRSMTLGGFSEVRTPILEHKNLFVRSTGETSEIVEKQMFELERSGETLVLRPEGTPGAARAYLTHSVQAQEPVSRWYYLGPMFRAEQPQRGRYRQFYQAGCELYGDPSPICDAELLDLLYGFLVGLGITDATVALNSIGGAESRAAYRDALLAYLRPRAESLSDHARKRLEDNPLRILDSKDPRDRAAVADAPSILDALTPEDREHWQAVLRALDALKMPYVITPSLVRGLDYYTRTVFEFQSNMGGLGSQNTLIAGGRYDNMLKSLGGPQIPAIGCGVGLDRVVLALGDETVPAAAPCFIAPMGERATLAALTLSRELREQGIVTVLDGRGNSMKSMLRRADGMHARICVVIGDAEVEQNQVQVKDLGAHTQEQIPRADAVARIVSAFKAGEALGSSH